MTSELSPTENERQLSVLTRLRTKHHQLLVESGIARRILDAKVPVNYLQQDEDFTEGTLLYPTRKKVGDIAIGTLWGGDASISGSCTNAPKDLIEWGSFIIETNPDSDVITLARMEANRNGWTQSSAFVGIQLLRGDVQAGIIPLDGISIQDANGLAEILQEVEEARESERLSCLEPESLINTTIGRVGPTPLP